MTLNANALVQEFDTEGGGTIAIGSVNGGAWSTPGQATDIVTAQNHWYHHFVCEATFAAPGEIGRLELHLQFRDAAGVGEHTPQPGSGATAFNSSKVGDFFFLDAAGAKFSTIIVVELAKLTNLNNQSFRPYIFNPMAVDATLINILHGRKAPTRL